MGRGNYYCPQYKTADLCLLEGATEKARCDCDYDAAKQAAELSSRTILNFHYFLNLFNFAHGLGKRDIIIDEADGLEGVIVSFISFDFKKAHVSWMGLAPVMPTLKTKVDAIIEWIKIKKKEAGIVMARSEAEIKRIKHACVNRRPLPHEITAIKRYKALKNFQWKLNILEKENLLDNWIYRYDDKQEKLTLKPIWMSRDLMDQFLYNHVGRILFMSATIPSKEVFCGLYGIEPEELDYLDLPNVWKSDRRIIIYSGVRGRPR